MENKHVTVSNLTLDLWLDYVKPCMDAETVPENVADDIEHCMTVACFNADRTSPDHAENVRREAVQMMYQLTVSAAYRPATRDSIINLAAKLTRYLQQ